MEHWTRLHWFELAALILLCLNLWFVIKVSEALKETNRWLAFLSSIQWDQTQSAKPPPE
jgi:hypothetical protein